ncbi:MAG: copper homeostasis membrane protein CopD [Caulobacteraceae bacterium]
MAAARFVHFSAICALFGLAAFPFYAYPRGEDPPVFRRAIRWSAVLALISGWAVLVMMTAGMGGSLGAAIDPSFLASAISDTAFGRVWMARILLSIVIVGLIVKPRHARDQSLLVQSGLLLASVALTGHSALPGGAPGVMHQLADAVHLIAAGWWIGGLLALVLAARTLGGEAHHVLERFSGVGYGAVAAIVLTGLFKSAILVATLGGVDSTAYGWTLLLKVALVGLMGLLALSNNFLITRRLKSGTDQALWLARLQHSVALEFALGLGVMAVVGALGALSPPISS